MPKPKVFWKTQKNHFQIFALFHKDFENVISFHPQKFPIKKVQKNFLKKCFYDWIIKGKTKRDLSHNFYTLFKENKKIPFSKSYVHSLYFSLLRSINRIFNKIAFSKFSMEDFSHKMGKYLCTFEIYWMVYLVNLFHYK